MTIINWQYIGGFFDGEGCIYFNPFLKNKGKTAVHCFAGIYQCENQAKVLYQIQKFLKKNKIDSHIYTRNTIKRGQNYRGVSLEIGHREELLNFLKNIKPYLFIKKQKCKEVIKQIKEYKGKRYLTLFEKEQIEKLWRQGKIAREISGKIQLNFNTIAAFIKIHLPTAKELGISRKKGRWVRCEICGKDVYCKPYCLKKSKHHFCNKCWNITESHKIIRS